MATSMSDIWNATTKTFSDLAKDATGIAANQKKPFDDALNALNTVINKLQAAQKEAQAYIKTVTDMQKRANLEAQQATILADMEEQVYAPWRAIRPYTNFYNENGQIVSKLSTQNFAVLWASTSIDKLKLMERRAAALVMREKAIATPESKRNLTMVAAGAGVLALAVAVYIANKE